LQRLSSYTASRGDTHEDLATIATIGAAVADLSSWRDSSYPSLRATVTSFDHVTSLPTFGDLAHNALNRDYFNAITVDTPTGRKPDFALLPAGGGKHGQRALSAVLQENAFHALVNNASLPLATRCRIRGCAQERAGDFQNIIPYTPDLELANSDYLPQFWYHYGLPQKSLLGGACCRSTCDTHGPRTFNNWNAAERAEFESGTHSLSCGAGSEGIAGHSSNPRKARSRGMNRNVVGKVYGLAGWAFSDAEKDLFVHDDNEKKVDGIATEVFASSLPHAVDTTVGCSSCERTYVTEAAAADSDYVTRELEKGKRRKHGSINGYKYLTAAFTTYGGWGKEFMGAVVRPYWKEEAKKEKAQGGNGWATQRAKRLFFQRAAVVLARGNANMIKQAMAGAARVGRKGA
jgi:hypothetical protein